MVGETPDEQTAARAGSGPANPAEPIAATLATLGGIAVAGYGVFGHLPILIAPGSALTLFGGAWLGNVLARRDVRLIPPATARERPPGDAAL